MSKFFKNKKFIIALLLVLILAGGIFVLGAPKANAGLWDILTKPGQAVTLLFAWIMEIVLSFFSMFLGLAASILEAVFKITKFTDIPVVNNGWQITRGLANMFFALILLIMAVATVLGIETFGARKILPRLIIAALLINFSLLFAGVIIDFSQVLTDYFITAAGGTTGSISTQLANGLNIARVFDDPAQFEALMAGGDAARLLNLGIGMLFGVIIIAIATFIVLAAALFLIIRIAVLWLLLIFAPLAWVAMIVPQGLTGRVWNDWWSTFFKWTFFAPIYAFFLYLACMAIGSGSFTQAFTQAQTQAIQAGFLSGFLKGGINLVLQYIVVAIILCGGLLVAQKFGIYGAGAVMSWGKRAGKVAGKWTARKGTGYDAWAPKVMSGAGTVVGTIPGFGKVGGMMKGKAAEMQEKRIARREEQLYRKHLSTLSDKELQGKTKDFGMKGLNAAAVLHERGTLKNAPSDVVGRATNLFNKFGMQKEARALSDSRVDILKSQEEINSKVSSLISENKLNMISDESLKDERVVSAIKELATAKQIEELCGKSPKYRDNMTKVLEQLVTKDPTDKKSQLAYASQTGDLKYLVDPAMQKEWAEKAGADGLKRMKNFDPTLHANIAMNIPPNLLHGVFEKLENGDVAKKIADFLKNYLLPTHPSYKIAHSDPLINNLAP